MALTAAARADIWRETYRQDKALWKALANLPNQAQRDAALDVLEAFWDDGLAANKAAVQTALGQTVSNELLKGLGRAWLRNLAGRL